MRMEPFVLSSRRSAQRESRDAAIMGFPGNDRLGSVVGKTKTPPSGRGGVLGPAATPGEDAAAVQPTNSLTRWRFRGQLPEFCGALSGGGRRKHLLGVGARCRIAFTGDFFHRPAVEDLDQSAAVADEARALQKPGSDGHGRAAHAEHLA